MHTTALEGLPVSAHCPVLAEKPICKPRVEHIARVLAFEKNATQVVCAME